MPDTIYALASARGKAGVAVVRVSGIRAFDIAKALSGWSPAGRAMSLRALRDGVGGVIDHALILAFNEGESFTGEATVEFQLHGSVAVVQAVLRRLSRFEGVRLADPGEFTRRALENNRLDLTQVEGLADLIDAETEAQRVQALRVFTGALSDKVQAWRTRLIRAAALVEATIDFADEEVPVDVGPEVRVLFTDLLSELRADLSEFRGAERVRHGFEVAIVGRPNVGKSTLLNRLAGREAAITSEVAGTTRDVIEVRMDLRGLPVTLLDTAGLRESDDRVERLGVARARDRARAADLRVVLLDGPQDVPDVDLDQDDIVLVGKADIVVEGEISGLTGQGIDSLVDRIATVLEKRVSGSAVVVRERHRLALMAAEQELTVAFDLLDEGSGMPEILAEALRRTAHHLERVVGRVGVEDLLDEIFRSFCLGK